MITQGQLNHLRALRINRLHSYEDDFLMEMDQSSIETLISVCTQKLEVRRR